MSGFRVYWYLKVRGRGSVKRRATVDIGGFTKIGEPFYKPPNSRVPLE